MTGESKPDTARKDRRLLLPVDEVAELLGVSPRTVHRMIWGSQIRATKIRGTWRVSRAVVEAIVTGAANEIA